MRSLRQSSPVLLVHLLLAAACGGAEGSSGELAFQGSEPFLGELEYDTGLVPEDSQAQVRVVAVGEGGVEIDARGLATDGTLAPVAGSGTLAISGRVALQIFAKVDVGGLSFDDLVHEMSYELPVVTQPFEPFALEGAPVEVRSDLPAAEIARVPIPNLPGGTLVVNVTGGYLETAFQGTCATVVGGDAQFLGSIVLGGEIDLSATIEVSVPFVGDQSFGPLEVTVPLPAADRAIDLGTVDTTTGERRDSTASLCDATGDGGLTGMDGGVGGPDGAAPRDGGLRPPTDGGTDAGRPTMDAGSLNCPPTRADCDGEGFNGCETSLSDVANCGGCNRACPMPSGAVAECGAAYACTYSCATGFEDCDGLASNGCEVEHARVARTCGTAVDLGAFDGDRTCGVGCRSNAAWDMFATRTGRTSAWFKARVTEGSRCAATIEHRVSLAVPPGVNFDLFLYRECGAAPTRSARGGSGYDETATISATDTIVLGGDFDYWVEVRYVSGTSCESWTLTLDGHDC
jgi:hypothetical protein